MIFEYLFELSNKLEIEFRSLSATFAKNSIMFEISKFSSFFLYVYYKIFSKKDVSFWNAVSDSKSTPTVRKYLSQDFLSEMTTSTDAEIEQMERIVF